MIKSRLFFVSTRQSDSAKHGYTDVVALMDAVRRRSQDFCARNVRVPEADFEHVTNVIRAGDSGLIATH